MQAYRQKSLENIKSLQTTLSHYNLKFETVPVLHCPDCWGCMLSQESAWKLAFSGDTFPSESFIHMAQDATVVFHDSTF